MKTQFEIKLEEIINEYSMENNSDTPDFILARYLKNCLDNFDAAVKEREEWYGRQKHIDDIEVVEYDGTGNPPPQSRPPLPTINLDSNNNAIDLQS